MTNQDSHIHALQAEIDSAPVVIFRSPLTEMVALRRELERLNVNYVEIEFGMANSLLRDRFHCLQAMTDYRLLPQVFINSEFVGGGDDAIHSAALAQLVDFEKHH
jgi:glutaredoxin-related protein